MAVRIIAFIIILGFNFTSAIALSARPVDRLLADVYKTKNSKDIAKSKSAKKLIKQGDELLPVLADQFTDTTITSVRSECHNRFLNKGEIAMILAEKNRANALCTTYRHAELHSSIL